MEKNSRIYLYIALVIPVAMIVFTVIFVSLSKTNLHPGHNFIFMLSKDSNPYYCLEQIQTKLFPDNYMQKAVAGNATTDCSSTKLYQYDFSQNKCIPMTLDAAIQSEPSLPTEVKSADGFMIKSYCGTSTLSGWTPSQLHSDICITNGIEATRLNISHYPDNANDYNYFYFLGWIQNTDNHTHQKGT